MKLLKNEKKENYQEIEVEYSFLWIKWIVKYRNFSGSIFRYKQSNRYYTLGLSEYIDVINFFKITDNDN